jgi:two-component system, LuxR family, response regulator FixJ
LTATQAKTVIFIVDDDDAVRDSLKLLLESHGMRVFEFSSTADFSAAYRPEPRACLIIDLHLPVEGGLEFLASERAKRMTLPAIMITGGADDATRAEALELGVSAFLEKPVDDRLLLDAITRALGA